MTSAVGRRGPGAAAYALDLLFALLVVAVVGLVAAGERGGDTFASNLLLSIPTLAAAVAAVAGGVLAGLALRHDRPVSGAGRAALRATFALPAAFALAVATGALWEGAQPVLGVALTAAMLATPVAAVYARLARKDRAALLVVPLAVGVIVAIWVFFELALPH